MRAERRQQQCVAFGLALLLLAVVSGLQWWHTGRQQAASAAVIETLEVRGSLGRLLATSQDLQTGALGYVVTGDEAFVELLDGSTDRLNSQLRELQALVQAHPTLRAHADDLGPLLDRRVRLSEAAVEVRRRAGFEVARRAVATGVGNQTMGQIRQAIVAMDQTAVGQLNLRLALNQRQADVLQLVTSIGSALGFGLLIAVFGLVLRENRFRRQAEAQAASAAEQLANVLDAASEVGIIGTASDGTVEVFNRGAERLLGYRAEDVVGKLTPEVFHLESEIRQRADDIARESGRAVTGFGVFVDQAQQGRPDTREWTYVRKDGAHRTVSLTVTAIRDRSGLNRGFLGVAQDITDRRKAEAERDRFFALSPDMLCIAGMDGHFKRINPAFTVTLGHAPEELLARPFLDFVHPDDRASTLAEMEKLGQGLPTVQFENRYRSRDGSWRWLSWMAQPVLEDGLLYATARDVTLRHEEAEKVAALNDALARQATQLTEANQELESFAYSVSHDLRAPLRHVQGYIQMLRQAEDGRLSERGQRFVETIADAGREMSQLIDDLLAFSRMGRAEMLQASVSLDPMVRRIIESFGATTGGRRIEWKVAPLPTVLGDSAMLKQVLTNLLDNAVKYTRVRDQARIDVGCLGEEKGWVTLFVRDNGTGFDMRYAHKLFGVFQRLHGADEFEGTGIGLATVRRILTRHGGRVWVEATPDQGATFYFTLKRAAAGRQRASGRGRHVVAEAHSAG